MNFDQNILWSKFFYRCKTISSRIVINKRFWSKSSLVENLLSLQNHFLKKSYILNNHYINFVFGKFLMLNNHLLKNSYPLKILIEKIYFESFLSLQNDFLRNSYHQKIWWKTSLVESLLSLQNHFLVKSYILINHIIIFFGKFLMLQNHFLKSSNPLKILIEKFFV